MRNSIVRTQSLKKYYKVGNQIVKALDGVDFEVQEQEFVAIITTCIVSQKKSWLYFSTI